jgi:hypothetical protein
MRIAAGNLYLSVQAIPPPSATAVHETSTDPPVIVIEPKYAGDPCSGSETVTVTSVYWKLPEAQFGVQLLAPYFPLPVAPAKVHDDHVMSDSAALPSPQARR